MRVRTVALTLALAAGATAQSIDLPPRSVAARLGSEILPTITGLSVQEREARLWHEFAAGNVPEFLREFVPVTLTRADTTGRVHTVRYEVAPDYLALGADHDFFRMPLTPILGQQLADLLDCSLPTRRMVDDVWAAAPVKLNPVTFSPTTYDILSPALFHEHHRRIELQRAGRPLGQIVAGTKKDVVVSARLATVTNRVAIYGWHWPSGTPIQPLSTIHVDFYADYSHGVRLVRNRVLVDGAPTTVAAVLADPVLHPLLSDEGPIVTSRYTVPTPTPTFPFVDAFPARGPELSTWRPKFTTPRTLAFAPPAPGGDGQVLVVQDPAGGTDSIRLGSTTTRDVVAEAELYCEYRPGLAADGFERIGVFVRDQGAGAFDGTRSQNGACYALCWDGHDGRLWCLRAQGGQLADLSPQPRTLPSTAWRRFRIEARGTELRFVVDGVGVLTTHDATFAEGEFGIGYHEYFATDANARGTRADRFFADVPDALGLRIDTETAGTTAVAVTRGVPGDLYFTAFTLVPRAFPNGWFWGLDPTFGELGAELSSGDPLFVGAFDGRGHGGSTLHGLPMGIDLYAVSVDVQRQWPPIVVSPPRSARTR